MLKYVNKPYHFIEMAYMMLNVYRKPMSSSALILQCGKQIVTTIYRNLLQLNLITKIGKL